MTTVKGGFPTPPVGVSVKNVFGTTTKDSFVGKAVYVDFLPFALAAGGFIPAPEALVAGKGLGGCSGRVDLHAAGGISAQKVVVVL